MLDIIKKSDIPLFEGRALDLLIESYSNATRTLQIRGFTHDAQIVADHITNSDRSLASSSVRITSVPVTLTVRASATGVQRGACYVKIWLRVEGIVVALLGAGYVTDTNTMIWPGGLNESSIDGPGLIRSITGTNPAAGVEISDSVPTGARWKIRSLSFTLVTDATVSNRVVRLQTKFGTNLFSMISANTLQTASLTWTYSHDLNGENLEASGNLLLMLKLPDMILPADYNIQTDTLNLQAGDNFSAPTMSVEEWIEP